MAMAWPGGQAGAAQMTPAMVNGWRGGRRSGGASKKRRKRKGKARARAAGKRRTRKLKFGSPAWRKKYQKPRRKK